MAWPHADGRCRANDRRRGLPRGRVGRPATSEHAESQYHPDVDAQAMSVSPIPERFDDPAQLAPGVLMNTAGSGNDFVGSQNGYGNFQVNGMSATSNGFIVDGLETNDPMTNLNSGLSTNLVLGLNSIDEVTVNTTSYGVDQGRYAASQVTYVTKSGTNTVHGNAYGLWNGARLNATNFFTKAAGGQKPDSNVVHDGGKLGGPIRRNKLFFFADVEHVRITVPIATTVTVPSPAFQQVRAPTTPARGCRPHFGRDVPGGARARAVLPAHVLPVPEYRRDAAVGLRLPADDQRRRRAAGGPAGRRRVCNSAERDAVEPGSRAGGHPTPRPKHQRAQPHLVPVSGRHRPPGRLHRSDQPALQCDLAAAALLRRIGLYARLHRSSRQPIQSGVLLVLSLFQPADLSTTLAAFPIVLQGVGPNVPFTPLGGLDNVWPQGRKVSRLEVNDNVTWTHGRHEWTFGESVRRLRFADYDFGADTTPVVTYTTLPQFIYGAASTATESFPTAPITTFNLMNIDGFAQDTVSVSGTVTWTIGLRAAWMTNPSSNTPVLSRLIIPRLIRYRTTSTSP